MFGEHHAIVSRPSDHTATIGLVAHEMGHAFGFLPDLYDTDGTSDGIGRWGVMGFGAAARLDLRRVGREWHGPCRRRGGADRSGFDPRTRSSPSARATRWRWCATRVPGHVSLIDGPRACSSDGCRKCQKHCRRQRCAKLDDLAGELVDQKRVLKAILIEGYNWLLKQIEDKGQCKEMRKFEVDAQGHPVGDVTVRRTL